jgi:hypothetical protein
MSIVELVINVGTGTYGKTTTDDGNMSRRGRQSHGDSVGTVGEQKYWKDVPVK